MRPPYSPVPFFLFVLLLIILFTLIQIGLISIAADKLRINPSLALGGLFFSLMGSFINIPVFKLRSKSSLPPPASRPLWFERGVDFDPYRIQVAINLGGAVLPLLFCIYLYLRHSLAPLDILLVTMGVALPSYTISRPIPGLGVAMPVFIPPILAALLALLIAPQQSAPLAYIGGTLGVILGADILQLGRIKSMGAPFVSIGGAGTFDGVFLTGIIAVLLA